MNIVNIKGMANITGGGIKNLTRMKDMKYVISDFELRLISAMAAITPAAKIKA